jgi:hypothetical protein
MKLTLAIDDVLLERAREPAGIHDPTALVEAGLIALIALTAGRRLAALAGTQPKMRPVPRPRSAR